MMLLDLIVALVVLGVALYVLSLVPMDGRMKQIITALVILAAFLYVVSALFGYHPGLGGFWMRR